MTNNIRILLAQIATFEAQHRAGLNPPCSALAEFFDTARLARIDVHAFDAELRPPAETPAPRAPLTFERLETEVVELRATVPLPLVARAVLDELGRHSGGRSIVIKAARGEAPSA